MGTLGQLRRLARARHPYRIDRWAVVWARHLAIYDIEAADEREARQVIDRINAANFTLSEALNVQSVNLGVYHEAGPPVTSGQVQQ
jgi:hypothetical protein